jgi:hypothetical protein
VNTAPIAWSSVLLACLGCAAPTDGYDGFGPTELRVDGQVEYRAETKPSEGTLGWLSTTVYVRATRRGGASVHYSGCPVIVRVYTQPTRSGQPSWDALAVPNTACPLPLIVRHLGRGEELALNALTLPREVLGDSLAPGHYYLGAVVRPNGDSLVVEAGEADLTP